MPDRSSQALVEDSLETDIQTCIEEHDLEGLLYLVRKTKPVDVAIIAEDLDDKSLQALVDMLPSSYLAGLIQDSEETLQERIASLLDDSHLLMVLDRMHDDEVADVLSTLAPTRVGKLLGQMREADRLILTSLLKYPDDTAGSIMTTAFLSLREDQTIEDGLELIRARGNEVEQLQTIYVLNPDGYLSGYVDLRKLLSSPRTVLIGSITEHHVITIAPFADQEEAASLVARYNVNSLPVMSGGRMLGIITVDDIIDVIIEEYDEDMLRLAGVNSEESLDSPLMDSVRMRLPWLLINLATAFLASFVVALFESTIERVVALSAIMTIVSGMGGNAGSQTMAIAVRHLSKESISRRETLRALGKEMLAGVINGAAVGLVTGIVVVGMYRNLYLSVIVLAAMVGNMVIAGTAGLLVPVVLKACGQDPAVSSSIFVTTATDVLGFLLFLGLARIFLPLLT